MPLFPVSSLSSHALQAHVQKIKKIQETLKKTREKISLGGNALSSNTLRTGGYKHTTKPLDFSEFKNVLQFNKEEKWIRVEPKMTMEELVKWTLPHGLIPPVVPEFRAITVGGAIMGGALESRSHRFGQFNDTCFEYQVLLGDGSLVTATAESNSDLFYALPGSYGTLGLLTSVKIRLVSAKPYVKLTYQPFSNPEALIKELQTPTNLDFHEGVWLTANRGVSIKGEEVDHPQKLPRFTQRFPWSPWFHSHLIKITQASPQQEYQEVMPLKDYLFRYDRGAFWMGRFILRLDLLCHLLLKRPVSAIADAIRKDAKKFKLHPYPSFLYRLLFGWAYPCRNLYRIWHQTPQDLAEQLFFIHDFYVPVKQAEEALLYLSNKTSITPIWLCPIRGTSTPQFLSPHSGKENFINMGIYGIPQTSKTIPALSAEIEIEMAKQFQSRKLLYSITYYKPELFASLYQMPLYQEIRKKYFAENLFLPLYNKVTDVVYSLGL